MKEIKLPSGAVLKITPSPFSDSRALYQAILKEAKDIPINSKVDMAAVYKDLFCIGFSSPEIEKCLWACFQRCTYNAGNGDLRIDEKTFEPVERRDDYMKVCMEVTKENVLPFVKSLYAMWLKFSETTESNPA